jgi:glycosyltransferase involved in cell wall biosynthesis
VVRDASIIRVIPNGIDTDRLQGDGEGSRIRAELGIPGDAPLLGSIGRLDPIKRFDLMIEAFGHLLQSWPSGPRPALVIAGDGPDQPRLKEVVARYGLEGDVHLLGWRNDIDDLHAAFTVFTMSSRSEGTSIALLEAMSAGLCPVVTDVGGNAHVLGEGLAHRLCVPEDPGALVTAWRRALADPEARERDGRVARKRVVEQFSVRKMVEEHALLYEEGLGATAASRSCHG